MIIVTSSFTKSYVFKIFSAHTITRSRHFQILFLKAPLSGRISVDARHNRRFKAAFSNFLFFSPVVTRTSGGFVAKLILKIVSLFLLNVYTFNVVIFLLCLFFRTLQIC